MNYSDFKFLKSGFQNLNSGKSIDLSSFMTKSGKWSAKFKKQLAEMSGADLNKITRKYNIDSKELLNIIPRYRNRTNTIYDAERKKFFNLKYFTTKNDPNKYVIKDGVATKQEKVEESNEGYSTKIQSLLMRLGNKEIQQVNVDMRKITLEKLFNILQLTLQGKKIVSSTIGSGEWITLSAKTLYDFKTKNKYVRKGELSGSEYDFLVDAKTNMIQIRIVDDQTSGNQINGGNFFRYRHTLTNIDVNELDIYCINQSIGDNGDYNIENCLIIALEESKKLSEKQISYAKTLVKDRMFAKCKIKELVEHIGITILLRYLKNGNVYTDRYGNSKIDIQIGLLDDHYFIIKELPFTSYYIKNYFELLDKDIKDKHKIFKNKGKKGYERSDKRFINSFEFVRILLNNKKTHLTQIDFNDPEILKTQYGNKMENIKDLEYDPTTNLRINELSERQIKGYIIIYGKEYFKCSKDDFEEKIKELDVDTQRKLLCCKRSLITPQDKYKIYFDFETYSDSNNDGIHKPYLACYETEDGEKRSFVGKNCAREMMNNLPKIPKQYDNNIMLIAHNCGYDFTFIFNLLSNPNPITQGSSLLTCNAEYYKNKYNGEQDIKYSITIKDSYKIIPKKLADFGDCFKLEQGKEVIPYRMYNKEYSKSKGITNFIKLEKAKQYVIDECGEDKLQTFLDNAKKWNCIFEDKINIMEYSRRYCEIDCEVLHKGYDIFKGWINKLCDIDIDNVLTIASVSNRYMLKEGAFEGVYELGGYVREYIQRCVVGGRTMCNQNKKWRTQMKMADYDAVSLYPSAMYRMEGYLKGKPKVVKDLSYEFLSKQDGYFVRIRPTSVGRKRHFPLASVMTEDGVRDFTNDIVGKEIYIDKTSLEDLIQYQKVDFDILDGYYYNEGRNSKVNGIIKRLFDFRRKLKKEGNPSQEAIKLLMNSSYGKTMLKPISTDTEVISKTIKDKKTGMWVDNWKKYLERNYNYINSYQQVGNKFIVKKYKPLEQHYNNVQVGVEILSMSKRIMNEVMSLAEDNEMLIYYQDTDSMHINYDKVPILEKLFEMKYNRELNGKDLGQFHIDFDLKGAKDEIYATESIFLGKKCYIDKLQSKDKDGNTIYGHHIRMKGVPEKAIYYEVGLKYGDTKGDNMMKMYRDLYEGETQSFDLLCGGSNDMFKRCNIGSIRTMGYKENGESEFSRSLKFKYEEGSATFLE